MAATATLSLLLGSEMTKRLVVLAFLDVGCVTPWNQDPVSLQSLFGARKIKKVRNRLSKVIGYLPVYEDEEAALEMVNGDETQLMRVCVVGDPVGVGEWRTKPVAHRNPC